MTLSNIKSEALKALNTRGIIGCTYATVYYNFDQQDSANLGNCGNPIRSLNPLELQIRF